MSEYKNSNGIKIGDLVKDNYERFGIVMGKADIPDSLWLREQNDSQMRDLLVKDSDGICKYFYEFWIKVLPLDGGAVVLTSDLIIHNFGQAGVEEYERAYKNANPFGKELLEMLPIASK